MKLLDNINEVSNANSYAFLLRHGRRDNIPAGEFGDEIELNDAGIRESLLFGNSISNLEIRKIFVSPIKRCIQTGELINSELRVKVPVIVSDILGNPGPYVYPNSSEAGKNYLKLGGEKLYQSIIDGETIPGFRNLKDGSDRLSNFINNESEGNGINLFISHDLIIAWYTLYMFNHKYTFNNWVGYLVGPKFRL